MNYTEKSAADFHDEAGKFITKINLFAEMAGKEAAQEEKLSGFIQKIRENTLELGTNMRDFMVNGCGWTTRRPLIVRQMPAN